MNTAIFINNISNLGGTEVVSMEYALRLEKQGDNVHFITVDFIQRPKELENSSIQIYVIRGENNHQTLKPEQIEKTISYCKEKKIDRSIFMINIPHKISPISNLELILEMKKNTKCEVVFHSTPKSYITRYWSKEYTFFGNILRKIKTFIKVAPYAKKFIKTLSYNEVELYTICRGSQHELKKYYGVDSKIRYNTYEFKNISLPEKQNVVTYCGRLSFEKNIFFLLKAWQKCDTENWTLRLIGDGKEKEKLENYCSRNNLKNIVFVGKVPHDDIYNLMAESKICCLTSFNEGYPTVIVEAMNVGNAILTTRYDGISNEILNERNSIITNYKVSTYAKALYDLLHNDEKTLQMGINAYNDCKKFYESKEYFDKI